MDSTFKGVLIFVGGLIVGAAGAGKSVLLRVLNDVLLGKQNVSNL